MCVCVCVWCVCVCVCVCVSVCVCVCVSVCVCVCMHACMWQLLLISLFLSHFTFKNNFWNMSCVCVCMCMCTCVWRERVCMCARMCACACGGDVCERVYGGGGEKIGWELWLYLCWLHINQYNVSDTVYFTAHFYNIYSVYFNNAYGINIACCYAPLNCTSFIQLQFCLFVCFSCVAPMLSFE